MGFLGAMGKLSPNRQVRNCPASIAASSNFRPLSTIKFHTYQQLPGIRHREKAPITPLHQPPVKVEILPKGSASPAYSSCGMKTGHKEARCAMNLHGGRAPPLRKAQRDHLPGNLRNSARHTSRHTTPRHCRACHVHVIKAKGVWRIIAYGCRENKTIMPRRRILFPPRPVYLRVKVERVRYPRQGCY